MKPWAVLLVAGALAGCGGGDAAGPPALRLGRDECAECGMSILEDRYAAALLVERDGRREYLVFDDIGCMFDKAATVAAVDRFVHDYAGVGWLRGDAAAFLGTEDAQVRTPMASGLIAYTSRTAATEGQRQFGGDILEVGAVAAWRRARTEERRRPPGG